MNKISNFFKKLWTSVKSVTRLVCGKVKDFFGNLSSYHIVKRGAISTKRSLITRGIAILSAFVFCSLLSIVMIGADPFKFIGSLFFGVFGSAGRIWSFAKNTAVLLMISLAVTPAFKMRFWNIGAEGQTLIGALASVAVIQTLGGKIAEPLLLIAMLAASVLIGGLWGALPAIFKAKWNTNETLFTLMMNYIATGFVSYMLLLWTPDGSSVLGRLDYGYLPILINEYLLPVALAVIMSIIIYVYLKYSKQGYEIAVVGESENTAKYVGINVGKVIIRTMIISGVLCGIVGFILVAGIDHSVSETTVGGLGFTAIMASWLAKFNPLVMIGSSAFIAFLNQGSAEISTMFNINSSFPDIVVGIFLFFIIGCEFFLNYKVKRHESTSVTLQAKGVAIK